MDIREMDYVIQDYCDSVADKCAGCHIEHLCSKIDGEFASHEDACRKAYEIIMHLQNIRMPE